MGYFICCIGKENKFKTEINDLRMFLANIKQKNGSTDVESFENVCICLPGFRRLIINDAFHGATRQEGLDNFNNSSRNTIAG